MKKHALPLILLGTVLVPLLHAAPAYAQATRTWVSGVGDDANPCSRTAPCKTFAGAISKTAVAGEIDCLDPGGFGAITITKSMTIDCSGVAGGILASLVNGVIVPSNTTAGAKVVLRNLTIQGAGNGINGIRYLAPGGSLSLEGVVISGFTTRAVEFAPSASSKLFVSNSNFSDNGGEGIGIRPTGGTGAAVGATVTHTNVHNNGAGITADNTNSGLINLVIKDTTVSQNVGNGVTAAANATSLVFVALHQVTSNGNNVGVSSTGTNSTVRIHESIVTGNATGLSEASSGKIMSFSSNILSGQLTTEGAATSTVPQQ
jgi:hypothetical protein